MSKYLRWNVGVEIMLFLALVVFVLLWVFGG